MRNLFQAPQKLYFYLFILKDTNTAAAAILPNLCRWKVQKVRKGNFFLVPFAQKEKKKLYQENAKNFTRKMLKTHFARFAQFIPCSSEIIYNYFICLC